MLANDVIPEAQVSISDMLEFIRGRVPGDLVSAHRGIVETVLCGVLLMEGVESRRGLEAVLGVSFPTVKSRISRLLEDSRASVWYFGMLDEVNQAFMLA